MSEKPRFEPVDEDDRKKFAEAQEAIAQGDEETLAEQLGVDAEGMAEDLMESVREAKEGSGPIDGPD